MAEYRPLTKVKSTVARLFQWKKSLALLSLLILLFCFLPDVEFDDPFSPVLLDRNGLLLDARVAQDHQWRFPPQGEDLPEKYLKSLILFEDQRFYRHLGVDPLAVARALFQNVKGGGRVSGASTLTMQVVRLWRRAPRTWLNKLYETLLAVRLELRHTKRDILKLYSIHAPMGRNIVGAESASWLYFGRPLGELSWGESALLAVLPNSPSSLNPGKGRALLLAKRNRLLNRLHENGFINSLTRDLAVQESLPSEKNHLGQRSAVHLLDSLFSGAMKTDQALPLYHSSIDLDLQMRAENVLSRHQRVLSKSRINDACALIIDHGRGEVLAYVGNAAYLDGARDKSAWLDLIQCRRSTGSILKPFLYASMFQEGELTPSQLVEDIPTFIRGFTPQNFSLSYMGAVPAKEALTGSLNIPAVRLLQRHGLQRFYDRLKEMGMNTLHREADGYGLTLILGGAEGSLWNMAELYGRLAQSALGNRPAQGVSPLKGKPGSMAGPQFPIHCGAAWLTLDIMTEVARPGLEGFWQSFASSRLLSWKTGTSQGFRDAWAIGVSPRFTLAVWVGNADGEGRPEITGLGVAAPVLFDLYPLLPAGDPFPVPWGQLKKVTLCRESGMLPGPFCRETMEALVPVSAELRAVCPYHQRIFLDKSGRWRVDSRCEEPYNLKAEDRFVLPPALAYYTERRQPSYRPLPPWRKDCAALYSEQDTMNLIYPPPKGVLYIPTQLDGEPGAVVFRLIHRYAERVVFWHLDDDYLGTTRHFHEMSLSPSPGKHILTLVDEMGTLCQRGFTVVSKEETDSGNPTQ